MYGSWVAVGALASVSLGAANGESELVVRIRSIVDGRRVVHERLWTEPSTPFGDRFGREPEWLRGRVVDGGADEVVCGVSQPADLKMGAALLRRRRRGVLRAAQQELLDPSKARWGTATRVVR